MLTMLNELLNKEKNGFTFCKRKGLTIFVPPSILYLNNFLTAIHGSPINRDLIIYIHEFLGPELSQDKPFITRLIHQLYQYPPLDSQPLYRHGITSCLETIQEHAPIENLTDPVIKTYYNNVMAAENVKKDLYTSPISKPKFPWHIVVPAVTLNVF